MKLFQPSPVDSARQQCQTHGVADAKDSTRQVAKQASLRSRQLLHASSIGTIISFSVFESLQNDPSKSCQEPTDLKCRHNIGPSFKVSPNQSACQATIRKKVKILPKSGYISATSKAIVSGVKSGFQSFLQSSACRQATKRRGRISS